MPETSPSNFFADVEAGLHHGVFGFDDLVIRENNLPLDFDSHFSSSFFGKTVNPCTAS